MSIFRLHSQPQFNAGIDYEGLGKGVKLLFNPAVGPVDQVTKRIWAPNGNAHIGVSHKGRVLSFDGVDDYYSLTGYPELTGNDGTFFMWCPTVGAADSFGHVYFGSSSPVVNAYQVDPSGKIFCGNSGSSTGISGWFSTENRSLVCVASIDPALIRAFVDGVDSGLSWAGNSASWGTGNKTLNLGRYAGGTSWDTNATMLVVGWTTEKWTSAEAKAFHSNPLQLFKYTKRERRFHTVAASGVTYTISPSGNFILGGDSLLLKTKVFLPTGDISFNGNGSILKGKVFSPLGTVLLNGTAIPVKSKSFVSSGTINFNGTSPFIRSKVLDTSGAITISGTASLSGAMTYLMTPVGKATFTGTSLLIKTHTQIPSGQISFSGSAPLSSNTVIITISTRLPLTGVGK